MDRKQRARRRTRALAAPFSVAPPSGARIRDRLRLSERDEQVLAAVGTHLGHLARADLAERVRIGMVPTKQNRRAERKKALTAASSSRWAGAITRTSEDQDQLALRARMHGGLLPPARAMGRPGRLLPGGALRHHPRCRAGPLVSGRVLGHGEDHPAHPRRAWQSGARLLGVDVNAGHLAACVVDTHGNPVGEPFTVPLELTGPTSRRDGRLRAAITRLIGLANTHGCTGIAVEDMGFTDARRTGRETMGRGKRGKAFRRIVAGIPTARFRERLRGMAHYAGLVVVAVDPAYTSRWGAPHWSKPLQDQTSATVTGRHAASVAIGRRALGRGIRRRPRPRTRSEDRVRRAEGQTGPAPETRGATGSRGMPGTPLRSGKTWVRPREQTVLSCDLQDRSGDHRHRPVQGDVAESDPHP